MISSTRVSGSKIFENMFAFVLHSTPELVEFLVDLFVELLFVGVPFLHFSVSELINN